MKFSIITSTYKRTDLLSRAVESVLNQTHSDWEMIIVNDSPDDSSYINFSENTKDSRIHYFKNEQNSGVNFSRNFALDNVSADSQFVIFLDDDDWFAKDALENFAKLISENQNEKWFVTNRAYAKGKSLTHFPKADTGYSYAWDYLISKRCKGDATHCIKTTLIRDTRFSKLILQAEEWIFFYQVGLKSKIFYHNHNSTISDGYNESSGLNFRKRTRLVQLKTLFSIIHEGFNLHLFYHPTFIIYLFMRFLRILVKN